MLLRLESSYKLQRCFNILRTEMQLFSELFVSITNKSLFLFCQRFPKIFSLLWIWPALLQRQIWLLYTGKSHMYKHAHNITFQPVTALSLKNTCYKLEFWTQRDLWQFNNSQNFLRSLGATTCYKHRDIKLQYKLATV